MTEAFGYMECMVDRRQWREDEQRPPGHEQGGLSFGQQSSSFDRADWALA